MGPRAPARTKHDGMAAVGGACMASLPAALGLTAPPHMHVRTASAWATELPANTGRRTHARARGHAVAGHGQRSLLDRWRLDGWAWVAPGICGGLARSLQEEAWPAALAAQRTGS